MTRRKRLVFAVAAVLLASAATSAVFLAVDVYLHSKYERSAGFNIWGYRGPRVGRKQPGEYRVAFFGGSSAYGYGVVWDEAIPAQLEQRLATGGSRPYRVVNLAYNNEGAFSFAYTMRDYDYLDYDLVCLYEGYNDLSGDPNAPNLSVFRHESPVFRATGYLPIFPIVFKEKAAAMVSGGDANALYRSSGKTVFVAPVSTRAAASVLRTTGEVAQSLERQLGRMATAEARGIGPVDETGCKYPWGQYCRSVADAIDLALARHRQVLFVTQPYSSSGEYVRMRHIEQQREASSMIARRYPDRARVAYVNLGESVDLTDAALSFDRMHLTAAGNARIAAALVQPVLQMAAH